MTVVITTVVVLVTPFSEKKTLDTLTTGTTGQLFAIFAMFLKIPSSLGYFTNSGILTSYGCHLVPVAIEKLFIACKKFPSHIV